MVSNCKCVKTCTESKSFRSKRQWCSLKKVVLKNLCRVSFLIKQIISEIIKFSCCICSGFLLRILSHTYQPWCKHFFKIVLVVQEMSFLPYLLSRDLKNDTNFIWKITLLLNFKKLNNNKVYAKHINLALRNEQNQQSRLMSILYSGSFYISNIKRPCVLLLSGTRESQCSGIYITNVSTKGSAKDFASNIKRI